MRRSPMYAGLAFALGLMLTLISLWLFDNRLPIVHAATFVVTNTNDSGPGSLRQAIADANAGPGEDTITITATGTISLSSSLDIADTVTIVGPGAGQLAVDGNNAVRVFNAVSGDLTLSDLTIQNGNAGTGDGGGLYAVGNLTLTNVTFVSNTSTGGAGGGAYVQGATVLVGGVFQENFSDRRGGGLNTSSLVVSGTRFVRNTSNAHGGGAYASTRAEIKNGIFQENRSGNNGGGVNAQAGLVLTNTQFISNTGQGTGGGAWARVEARVTGGLFQGNTTLTARGGGLRVDGTLQLAGTRFVANTSGTEGGGLYVFDSSASRIVNALLARNTAGDDLGAAIGISGTASILHTTIASSTPSSGAAIYVHNGTVGITDTIVASYTVGISTTVDPVYAATSQAIQDYNLFFGVTTPTTGTVSGGAHNGVGDPAFLNPASDDYHLTTFSAAIDAGVDAGVTTDLDGTPRPYPPGGQFDIGAYEAAPDLVITKAVSPEPAVAGTSLYYTITIVNQGPLTVTGVILSDTLPPSTTLGYVDQTDDDGGLLGFGGGTLQNVQWNDPRPAVSGDEWLGLVDTLLGTGVYTSRVMDASSVSAWNNLRWTPWRPYGKELPDNRQAESLYRMGNADMTGNDLLLHLNESAGATAFNDASGSGHNGTCPAGAGETCPTAGAPGQFNGALHFDGALSDTVVITDATNPVRYAIELWVRPSVVSDTSFILRTATVSGTTLLPGSFSHLLGLSGDRFLHLVNDGSGARTITGTTAVTPGTWYHVVGTAQSGGEIVLYVNGVEEGRLGGLGTLWTGGDQYRLGSAYGVSGTTYFSGDLDEVAVYSRTLSAAEVTDHYLRGALRLNFQVRSCDDALCDTETFIGPGGFITTSYSELNNPGLGLPSVTLTGVPNNRYFQYKAALTTGAPAYSPQLHDVSVGPNHYAIDASQGSCSAPNASAFTCDLGVLMGGGVITVTTQVALHPSTLGIITNTATVTSTWPDADPLNNTAIATTTVIAQSDLVVVKEDADWYGGTDPVNPGSPLTYTLRVYNAGPSTAWSVTVTDTPPITVSGIITPASWSCQNVSNTITCTTPSLLRYTWQDIILTGTAPLAEGVITNTAWITVTSETDPADNSDTQTTLITPLSDLVIVKSAYPDPVNPGETLTYTIVVTNSGPYTATNVIVTDTLQSGLIGGGFGAGWSCGLPGNIVICSLFYPLTPTYSANFNITVTAPMSGLIANNAVVTSSRFDPDTSDNWVTTYAGVRPVADLSITKSDVPDPVFVSTPLTYTLIVTNAGPVSAGALTTTLTFTNSAYIGIPWVGRAWPYPSAMSFSSVPGLIRNMTVTLNNFSHSYPADVSALLVGPGGQSVVLMSSAGGGADANGITLRFNDVGVSLPVSGAMTSTLVYRPTNYGIGSLPAPAPSGPHGGSLSAFYGASPNGTWQLYVYDSVDSDGGNIAGGWSMQLTTVTSDTVTLTDMLPSGLTSVGVSAAPGWMCGNVGGGVTCMVNSLPVSVPATLTIAATAPITGGVITNTASITSTTADLYPADNTTSITTTVVALADLQIGKNASPDPVGAGQLLTYTLTFTNAGPSPLANVTIYDVLPVSVTVVSAPGCAASGNMLTCTLASSGVNIPDHLVITVLAPPDAGVITNTAALTSTAIDSYPLDNTAWVTTTVTPLADLSISKTGTPSSAWPGAAIVYTVIINNTGPSLAANLRFTDTLPVSTTFQSLVSPAGWTCLTPAIGSTGNIVCTSTSLVAGGTSAFTIAVNVSTGTAIGTLLANTAAVSSDTPDLTTPNIASAATVVSLYKTYLPLVMRNYAAAPDLIVSGLVVTSTGVQVIIKNQGDTPVTQIFANEFWVDLYVNPNPPPTGVNQVWKDGRSAHGMVWGVTQSALPLAAGATITLTGSVNDPYYQPDLSDMAWPLPAGTIIYVQVDSANTQTSFGAVLENHEITGGAYNNIAYTTSIAGIVSEIPIPVTSDGAPHRSGHLPPRP